MKIFDLSMGIDEKTPAFPGEPKPEIKQFATIEQNGWNEKSLVINSHLSTHIDAPAHMIKTGKTLTDFPISRFIGDAVVIDARGQQEINPDIDCVKVNDIVFFFTGHTDKAYTRDFFTNNPVITKETAMKLISKKIRIVGIDSFTPDNAPYDVHKLLFRHDILIVENLINLKELSGKRFRCYILPLKIMNADGAPCRIVGIIN